MHKDIYARYCEIFPHSTFGRFDSWHPESPNAIRIRFKNQLREVVFVYNGEWDWILETIIKA
jgi:hypothetical protein